MLRLIKRSIVASLVDLFSNRSECTIRVYSMYYPLLAQLEEHMTVYSIYCYLDCTLSFLIVKNLTLFINRLHQVYNFLLNNILNITNRNVRYTVFIDEHTRSQ